MELAHNGLSFYHEFAPRHGNALQPDTTYEVQLATRTAAGLGAFSHTSRGTTTSQSEPGAPPAPTLTPQQTSMTVQWSAPASDGNLPVTQYDLRFHSAASGWSTRLRVGTGVTRSYSLTGLTRGVEYMVQVRAVNSLGAGPWSPSTVTVTGATAPAAPRQLSTTAGNEAIALEWRAPSTDNGSPVTAYDVQHRNARALGDPLGTQQLHLEFNLDTGNPSSRAITLTDDYAYVAEYAQTSKVFVYRLSDGARQETREFNLATNGPGGIATDGTLLYVADTLQDRLYVYRLSDGARQNAREFDFANGHTGSWTSLKVTPT